MSPGASQTKEMIGHLFKTLAQILSDRILFTQHKEERLREECEGWGCLTIQQPAWPDLGSVQLEESQLLFKKHLCSLTGQNS